MVRTLCSQAAPLRRGQVPVTSTRRTQDPGPAEEPGPRRERAIDADRTRDLVQKLTRLADRYAALPPPPQPLRGRERSASITLMRSAVASGSRLIDAAPPAAREPSADAPVAAELRDQRASTHGRPARVERGELDPGFADRFVSAVGRGAAADEKPGDPRRLLEQLGARATFHQAQGLLMARTGMDASEAFDALLLDAQQRGTSMTEAAVRVVRELTTHGTSELLFRPQRGDA